MVSPHGGLGLVTLPYHDLRPFFYLTSSHLAESKVNVQLDKIQISFLFVRLVLFLGQAATSKINAFSKRAQIAAGLVLISITSGSNISLSMTLIGELGHQSQHGRRMGVFYTMGDLTSAIGPIGSGSKSCQRESPISRGSSGLQCPTAVIIVLVIEVSRENTFYV